MANILTNTTFQTTYKDDFIDSDNYHRVLFNAGRALQAREITQSQTIIQKEIERAGTNLFNEGSAVRAGNITLNTTYEFIKLASSSNSLATSALVGEKYYVSGNPNIAFTILEVVSATDTDPATLYVQYDKTSGGTSGSTAVRVPNNSVIIKNTSGIGDLRVAASDATGRGSKISIGEGDYFVKGHFVFVKEQSIFLDKYGPAPTVDIGFQIIEDIVTVDDDNALYDNQGAVPNIASPGADRYRISLTLKKKTDIAANENFVYVARIDNGQVIDESNYGQSYNILQDVMAQRTKEESGDYVVRPFIAKFDDLDDSNLQLSVTSGIAYVDGYRLDIPASKITIPKAQETESSTNQNVVVTYGNFVVVNGANNAGLPNINEFEEVNIYNSTGGTGSIIGTTRIRALEENIGSNYKLYLFDIQMSNGAVFTTARSLGTSTSNFFNIVLESGDAVLKSTANNSLLFDLPYKKPSATGVSISALTVQRRYIFETDGTGAKTLLATDGDTLTSSYGHTAGVFTNTGDWIVSTLTGSIVSATIASPGTTVQISGLSATTQYELLAYVAVDTPVASTKQLNENQILTKAWPTDAESDGAGLRYIDLGVPDIYKVNAIKQSDSDGADLSTNFIIDNGQRDNFYAKGRLIERGGSSIPNGNIFIKFDHFTISTLKDFFSVNSYAGISNLGYENIPSHTKANGEVVSLRDVFDFRSYENASGNYTHASGIHHLPQNTDTITASIEYYLPRKDRLVATVVNNRDGRIGKGDLKVVQGVSSLTPQFPGIPSGSIPLYDIELNAYTLNQNDVTTSAYDNRRYTMKDIARLERRLDDLVELTTLNLLEVNTSVFDVLDSSGFSRTKAGFLADNFTNYALSENTSTEYRATVDPLNNILRPEVYANNTRLIWDSDASVALSTERKGDLVLLNIDSDIPFVNQLLATGQINVNPFSVITQNGFVEISPASDVWVETSFTPDIIVGGAEATQNVGTRVVNDINTFQSSWFGVPTGGRVQVVTGSSVIRDIVGERVLDISVIPFMRSVKVGFRAHGLRPNTAMFPFFDGINISNYARAESQLIRISTTNSDVGNTYTNLTSHPDGTSALISDSAGDLIGSFIIPSNDSLKFRTGDRIFKLLDVNVDEENDASTVARATFSARGVIETRERSVRTTRMLDLQWIEDTSVQNRDPLAQTFRIDQFENPNGLFLTKVDIFFKTKSARGIPVSLEVRTVENGIPTEQVIPGATAFLLASQVNLPSDQPLLDENKLSDIVQVPTTFTFEEPIFLNSGQQYAIVILAETTEYQVYTAKTLDFLLGSTQATVTKQPTLGSLFISQNASTWTADQTKDLMFRLYRAQFASSGSAILENVSIPSRLLENNPFQTTSGSSTVKVISEGHGLSKGDKVNISGLNLLDSYAGIDGTSLSGTRTVLNVDHTGFTFAADSDAGSTIRTGSNGVIVSQNMIMNSFFPTVETLVPESVRLSASIKTTGSTAGQGVLSYASRRNIGPALSLASSYVPITLNELNELEEPKAILSDSNESFHLNANEKSFNMKLDLSTTDDKVSPVLDLQRAAITTFENVIDKQDSAATDGFNVPISFVAETHPSSGSGAAKHITSVITLAEQAVGLKIILSANRPTDADFDVYYKIGTTDDVFDDVNWIYVEKEAELPADNDNITFRDYEYLAGGIGGNLPTFTKYQVKVVMNTTNSSRIPIIKDLRAIALVT
jgi:hypothetical protein